MAYSGPWRCSLCGVTVDWKDNIPILPAGYFDTCKLKDHLIGNECVAYRDIHRARKLLAAKQSNA